VAEKNAAVEENPELINSDPYGDGWLIAIEGAGDLGSLMTAADYTKLVEEGE
jgi:glycine cleavage system H protein